MFGISGRQAVRIGACCFARFLVCGIGFSYGLFYKDLLYSVGGENNTKTAVIFAVFQCITQASGALLPTVLRYLNTGQILIFGGIVSCTALAITSVTTSYWLFLIFFGFIQGVGLGFVYVRIPVEAAGILPPEKSHMAVAIANTGDGIGLCIMPLVFKILMKSLTWRQTFLITSGLLFNIVISGTLLLPRLSFQSITKSQKINKKNINDTTAVVQLSSIVQQQQTTSGTDGLMIEPTDSSSQQLIPTTASPSSSTNGSIATDANNKEDIVITDNDGAGSHVIKNRRLHAKTNNTSRNNNDNGVMVVREADDQEEEGEVYQPTTEKVMMDDNHERLTEDSTAADVKNPIAAATNPKRTINDGFCSKLLQNLAIFRRRSFLVLFCSSFLDSLAVSVTYTFLAAYVQDKIPTAGNRLSKDIFSTSGAVSIAGRLLVIFMTNRLVPRWFIYALDHLFMGFVYLGFLLLPAHSFGWYYIFGGLRGFFSGNLGSILVVVCQDVCGKESLSQAFSYNIFAWGIGSAIGASIGGVLSDQYQSSGVPLMFAVVLYWLNFFCLLLLYRSTRNSRQQNDDAAEILSAKA